MNCLPRKISFFVLTLLVVVKAYSQSKNCGEIEFKKFSNEIYHKGICQIDTSKELNKEAGEFFYSYCNSEYFTFYSLTMDKRFLLLEITINTGTGGYHYYLFKKTEEKEMLNAGFFQGYLDSIICNPNNIENKFYYSSWIDSFRFSTEFILQDSKFVFSRIIDIKDKEGNKVPSKKFEMLEQKYGLPKLWKL